MRAGRGRAGVFQPPDISGGSRARRLNKEYLARAYGFIFTLEDKRGRLSAFLHWAAGPLVAGLRPAALVRFPRGDLAVSWAAWGDEFCAARGISALALRESTGGSLVLLFRRRHLVRKALTGVPARFLSSMAYPVGSGVDACLRVLQDRFQVPGEFPHEIGIFLGYPPEDVIGFRSGRPSPYSCRGYWQVYHRPDRAERTFAYLDAARIKMVRDFFYDGGRACSAPDEPDEQKKLLGDGCLPLSAVPLASGGNWVI